MLTVRMATSGPLLANVVLQGCKIACSKDLETIRSNANRKNATFDFSQLAVNLHPIPNHSVPGLQPLLFPKAMRILELLRVTVIATRTCCPNLLLLLNQDAHLSDVSVTHVTCRASACTLKDGGRLAKSQTLMLLSTTTLC